MVVYQIHTSIYKFDLKSKPTKISRFFTQLYERFHIYFKNQNSEAMKRLFLFKLLVALLMISSCKNDNDDQIVCTQQYVYGLNIVVLDATTGNPLVEGVTVEATDGSYNETLQLIPGLEYSFAGAGERVGIYTVTVTKDGYQTYTSSPIIVTRNVCHVIPQSLTVNLQSN